MTKTTGSFVVQYCRSPRNILRTSERLRSVTGVSAFTTTAISASREDCAKVKLPRGTQSNRMAASIVALSLRKCLMLFPRSESESCLDKAGVLGWLGWISSLGGVASQVLVLQLERCEVRNVPANAGDRF